MLHSGIQYRKKAIGVVRSLEYLGLLSIALATLVAVAQELYSIYVRQEVILADLLLLFIYLEVFVMISGHLESGKMPIRIPIFIAIVALARHITIDMSHMGDYELLAAAGASLILALAVLCIRYGHIKFPYVEKNIKHED